MNEPASATKRRLLSRSAFIFAIRFFPLAAMLAVQIAFSHFVPKELNGIYQQLWVYMSVFVVIACFGIPPLLLTHSPQSIHRWLLGLKARHMTLFSLWLCVLTGLMILLFRQNIAFNPWVLVIIFFAQAIGLLIETYLIIVSRYFFLAVMSFLYALLFCAVHYLFIESILSFSVLLWAIVGLNAIRAGVLALVARKEYATGITGQKRSVMSSAIRKQWMQLGIYDVFQVVFRYIDKVFISWIVGPALFSIYFYGTTDVPFVPVLLGAVGGGLLIQLAAGNNSISEQLKLVNYSGAMLARIVFPLFFFLFFFRYEFIELVFSNKYLDAVPLFAISVMALPLRAYNYTSILQHQNQVKTINRGAILDLCIALALAYPLYLWKGLQGVAFAFMISSYVQALFYLSRTAKHMRCSILQLIPWKQWLIMLIVFGFAGIALHDMLARTFNGRLSLLLGFLGTGVMMLAALSPVIFSRKKHG